MSQISYSTFESRCHSSVSKSSNTSVSSILRDSSSTKPKKQNSVRFSDSPVPPDKTITIKLSEICNSRKSLSPDLVASPSHSFLNKEKPKNTLEKKENPPSPLKNINPSFSPKPNQAKSGPAQHNKKQSPTNEPRFTPKVLNYAFRNQNFYEKLSKFYSNSESPNRNQNETCQNQEKIVIKLDQFIDEKNFYAENSLIKLTPCISNNNCYFKERVNRLKNHSPSREPKKNSKFS